MVWRTSFITMSTSFLLGTTFTHWIADHNVLWKTPVTEEAIHKSITYYSLLSSSSRGLGWAYILVGIILVLSIGGRSYKGYHRKGGEVLFDGGSLVLIASIIYYQINEVLPAIALMPNPLPKDLSGHPTYPALQTAVRDLATSNIMAAVMLTGLITLQAGRYYSKRPSSPPQTVDSTTRSADASSLSTPETRFALVSNRSGTPFRELTKEEAFELNASSGEDSRSPSRQVPRGGTFM
ncbi:hypothetical protein L202_05526 [Cryptococcus amylolentus CBS 6039]|uniref:Shr3 amino acid permease chaperone n=1 Tax=Cryptococcus amylolentus CBS 6039 TaxID=1295533 RepID=A0A1E3HKU0_9TREE|nr:hypothetical protein L202_05526 [Cryptococcus amylolentus CBS 6039]ODN76962.1 hypothetical protein L202_05526 [Cryptococcus amylolentus CBS 6039]